MKYEQEFFENYEKDLNRVIKNRMTIEDMALKYNKSQKTIRRHLKAYDKDGMNGLIHGNTGKRRFKKITPKIQEYILNNQMGPFLEELENPNQPKYKHSGIHRANTSLLSYQIKKILMFQYHNKQLEIFLGKKKYFSRILKGIQKRKSESKEKMMKKKKKKLL